MLRMWAMALAAWMTPFPLRRQLRSMFQVFICPILCSTHARIRLWTVLRSY